jgi:uncharacterized protein (DUF1778 family)
MRDTTISLCARPGQRKLIDRAAHLQGASWSDFVLEAACDKAQAVLLERVLFELKTARFRQLVKLLDAPPERNPGLERLMAIEPPWVRKATKH